MVLLVIGKLDVVFLVFLVRLIVLFCNGKFGGMVWDYVEYFGLFFGDVVSIKIIVEVVFFVFKEMKFFVKVYGKRFRGLSEVVELGGFFY